MVKMAGVCAAALVLSGCAAAQQSHPAAVDIAKVSAVKSSFGPGFTVSEIPTRALDPAFFASRKLPDGLTFQPPACAKEVGGPQMPAGVQGNMAAVSAEGNGNRFVVIALETSQPLPFTEPGPECKKVSFSGSQLRGGLEVVDTPKIEGTQTQGVHRVLESYAGGGPRVGELYDYLAQFGVYQVMVIANPLVVPGQHVVPVDTRRARDLLVAAVAAIRG